MDVLSDVLRTIRLEGALFLHGEFQHPWCVQTPSGAELAGLLQPAAQPLAVCHYVLEGRCWAALAPDETVPLQAGDIVVFPHGDPHRLGSGAQLAPARFDQVVQRRLPDLNVVRYGGSGDATRIVCGWFAFERDLPHPLLTALPPHFRTAVRDRPAGAWIEQSIRYAVDLGATQPPGADALAAKVAELLFVEALRGHLDALPATDTGWLAGLRDPQIGRCLALLHAEPARDWTVAELAQAVHLSRSALAERFTRLVRLPPMQYLTRWRLALAARLLCDERSSLAQVAWRVGYESEAAFNRAFKRAYGAAPGLWRRRAARSRAADRPDMADGAGKISAYETE